MGSEALQQRMGCRVAASFYKTPDPHSRGSVRFDVEGEANPVTVRVSCAFC